MRHNASCARRERIDINNTMPSQTDRTVEITEQGRSGVIIYREPPEATPSIGNTAVSMSSSSSR